jgi:GTP-binding protein
MPRIIHAEFIKSAQGMADSLPEDRSEVVFLGRSNVGKSSTINTLVNRKSLAKSSSTPGKTQLINFFDVVYKDETQEYPLRLVDLPGFGYAKVSKTLKEAWQYNLLEFIQKRISIRLFVHLRDARHPRTAIDEDVYLNLKKIVRPDQAFVTVFTKMDKLNQKERAALKKEFPDAIGFSNLKSHTIDPLHKKILYTIFGVEA